MAQDEVLDKFHTLKSSFSDGEKDHRFVYVPGTRKDRVLLVAHADTVFGDEEVKFDCEAGIFYSTRRNDPTIQGPRIGMGIGADDRAGCAILWHLRHLGHSLLVTSGEEDGCITSRWMIKNKWWNDELNNTHQFAVQFDRKGSNDIVFYSIGTNKFVEYVKEQTKYKPTCGTSTDIKHLCENICGVNVSVGYYNEHTPEEKLIYSQWKNSLYTAHEWLKQPDLPKFPLDKKDLYNPSYNNSHCGHMYDYDSYDDYYNSRGWHNHGSTVCTVTEVKNQNCVIVKAPDISTIEEKQKQQFIGDDMSLTCPHCGKVVLEEDWIFNTFKCSYCKKEF